ncbi:hypothetical protein EMIHUDRAFT_223181 [Emiliania huxleyi CCMP1516]|uniref:Uncharacterized protein n=2 Tax=Emiliania huxleyi TaxID=2903 RepID=A0A0D3KW37_EMIH1|nr:hypothetical protein EMIHUDRAFT_223181 [Emiliania huxleyi CCMP1516]EOD39972.1 hypothetical protein EMIHUDRAFT_223181 [Emiliania huxleyi CCMP1516]|eukprot:XP_005792401.1 hypothetical protein EMIHUDRAFT_223181 [Emiliania huxleyi CCMP1516]
MWRRLSQGYVITYRAPTSSAEESASGFRAANFSREHRTTMDAIEEDAAAAEATAAASRERDLRRLARAGALGEIQELIGQRVNVDAADSKGTTALMNCAEAEGQSGVAVLLGAGADLSIQSEMGQTALMWAARHGKASLVETLLVAHADPHVYCHKGRFRAIDYARFLGHAAVLEAFNEPDWVGWLPPPLRATAVHAVRMVPVGSRIWGNPMLLSALVVAALRLGLHWAFGLLSERATAS